MNPYRTPASELSAAPDAAVGRPGKPCSVCGSTNTIGDAVIRSRPGLLFVILFGWIFLLIRAAFAMRTDHCRDCGGTNRYKTTGSWIALAVLILIAVGLKEIPAWDDMNANQRKLFERQMETFAGFAAHTDAEVGRLVTQLETIGGLETALAPGKHTIHYEFIPDEAKPGTGGKSILSVDGKKVAEGQIPRTQPFMFSADEGADVGLDGETNVSNDYQPGLPSAFTGRIVRVTVEQK